MSVCMDTLTRFKNSLLARVFPPARQPRTWGTCGGSSYGLRGLTARRTVGGGHPAGRVRLPAVFAEQKQEARHGEQRPGCREQLLRLGEGSRGC